MKNEDNILMMYNIIRDLGYTGRGDRQSNRKTFFTITQPKLVDDIQKKTFDEITATLMIYKVKELKKLSFHPT